MNTEDEIHLEIPVFDQSGKSVPSFDWVKDTPEHGFSIILDGVRNAGKSHALGHICNLIKDKYKFNACILISGTAGIQVDTFNYVQDNMKYEANDLESILSSIIDIQKEDLKQHKGDKTKCAKILILLDDVIASKTSRGSGIAFNKQLEELFILGRHLNLHFFLLTQHLNSISNKMKSNADVICCLKTGSYTKKKYLLENFMYLGNDDKKFAQNYLSKVWDRPYSMLVINQHKIQHANSVSEFVYRYVAPSDDIPTFEMHPQNDNMVVD